MLKLSKKYFLQNVSPIIFGFSTILFFISYWQSHSVTFRVEQWDAYHYYYYSNFNLLDIRSWLAIAFWSPLGDFRMVPLSYIWHFFTVKIFGINMFFYWLLSVVLHIANCFLISKFVSVLLNQKSIKHGLLAGSFLMLFPAKFEAIIWTLFGYKLMWSIVILSSLILFEYYLKNNKNKYLTLSMVLLFLSWYFYEASLPLGFAFIFRFFIKTDESREVKKIHFVFIIICLYCAYLVTDFLADTFISRYLGMSVYNISLSENLHLIPASAWNWVMVGWIFSNIGLQIQFRLIGHFLYHIKFNMYLFIPLMILWWAMLRAAFRTTSTKKELLYLLIILFGGTVLVLIGRTATNAEYYLSGMSVYQYYPLIMISGILGLLLNKAFIEDDSIFRKYVVSGCLIVILSCMAFSNYKAVKEYMRINRHTVGLIERVKGLIEKDPDIRLSPGKIRLPFAPRYALKDSVHTYRMLHLLFGDNIIKEE